MRAMINGVWHSQLADDQAYDDIPNLFRTPASRVDIDVERLAREPRSYHLYAALACPFAHRVLLGRSILGIDLPVTFANPWLGNPEGWFFEADPSSPLPNATKLWQVYRGSNPEYSGQVSIPLLWDRQSQAIASAESDEILEMLLAAYASRADIEIAIAGEGLDQLCRWIKLHINQGIYAVGFARSQSSYDRAHDRLLEHLTRLDESLRGKQFLWQNRLSKADLYLFPTAIRFDAAYQGAFQILDLRWSDFPELQAHLTRIAAIRGVMETVNFDDYRRHYFDDGVFPLRHPAGDGHYILPRTPNPFA